jgi:hypothetical protein
MAYINRITRYDLTSRIRKFGHQEGPPEYLPLRQINQEFFFSFTAGADPSNHLLSPWFIMIVRH